IGGVHRYADIWVNGEHVRRHVGYVVDFEIDLTEHVSPGETATIAIRIDSEQEWEIDALTGCFDVIDHMFVVWGGIHHHVWLETRDDVWIEDAFAKPDISQDAVDVEVTLAAETSGERRLMIEAVGPGGKIAGRAKKQVRLPEGNSRADVRVVIADPLLWSPNHPWLYRLRLSLHDGRKQTDEWETRFGMREIEIRGADIYLNGKRTYLHGYGDDTIYPKTLCPPADHKEYRERMALVREFGFTYVRHHSTVPLPEYFDAADEHGILVQPELPIAYGQYLERGLASEAATELYRESWRGMIRRYRNHPSVFGWCMGNEVWAGFSLAEELYETAKALDPTRPVYDTDGVPPGTDRPTLDVLPAHFNVLAIPVLDYAEKHRYDSPPAKPVISHEMGNYATYPDVRDAKRFKHTVRPFWLERAREALEARGMLGEVARLAECSERLQALCHKINVEDQRMSPHTDGHSLWLFQDYWTNNTGLVNHYYKIKGPGSEWYTKFIADVVLLADLPGRTFTAGDSIEIPLHVSDFGEEEIVGGRLAWTLSQGAELLASGELPRVTIAEKGLNSVGTASVKLPRLKEAAKLTLSVGLESGAGRVENDWDLWVFPRSRTLSVPAGVNVAQLRMGHVSAEYPEVVSVAQNERMLNKADLLLARRMSKPVLDYLRSGGRVILTSASALFQTERSTFEPAWWLGGPGGDASVGTVIYDSPALDGFPHDGWCDLQFLELIDGQSVMLLDGVPGANRPIIRAIDAYAGSRHRAYVAEWRVGRGRLLVATLNLGRDTLGRLPEARWMLRSLVGYAVSDEFSPEAELSVESIAQRVGEDPIPQDAIQVEGFAEVIAAETEQLSHVSFRGESANCHVVRALAGTHFVEWASAPVPETLDRDKVTFAWAGGLGWIAEPEALFTLLLNGEELLTFGVVQQSTSWTSTDGRATLHYDLCELLPADSLGVFYLTVPSDSLALGKSVGLRVATETEGSHRWFMLHDYTDVWAD
ncbi:MAG TPA: glycoside hydrolase family 2 TIM barrel-domain containing protein, partial [Armatimonadota bacterium]|nr:glycoside hydrolase family 2 TIM barrel-domain containing protein [Armatimonadota bacterium]